MVAVFWEFLFETFVYSLSFFLSIGFLKGGFLVPLTKGQINGADSIADFPLSSVGWHLASTFALNRYSSSRLFGSF